MKDDEAMKVTFWKEIRRREWNLGGWGGGVAEHLRHRTESGKHVSVYFPMGMKKNTQKTLIASRHHRLMSDQVMLPNSGSGYKSTFHFSINICHRWLHFFSYEVVLCLLAGLCCHRSRWHFATAQLLTCTPATRVCVCLQLLTVCAWTREMRHFTTQVSFHLCPCNCACLHTDAHVSGKEHEINRFQSICLHNTCLLIIVPALQAGLFLYVVGSRNCHGLAPDRQPLNCQIRFSIISLIDWCHPSILHCGRLSAVVDFLRQS